MVIKKDWRLVLLAVVLFFFIAPFISELREQDFNFNATILLQFIIILVGAFIWWFIANLLHKQVIKTNRQWYYFLLVLPALALSYLPYLQIIPDMFGEYVELALIGIPVLAIVYPKKNAWKRIEKKDVWSAMIIILVFLLWQALGYFIHVWI